MTETPKKKNKGTGLKYIPIFDFFLIPRYLIEQVEPLEFEVDRLYAMSREITANPMNILGAFANENHEVKGFLWANVNPLNNTIYVHILSVDKEYQGRGIIGEATNILRKLIAQHGLKEKIVFRTVKPEAFKRWGYKESEIIIMEG